MAKNLQSKRTITEKVQIKGYPSTDGLFIIFEDDNNREHMVKVSEILQMFQDREIVCSVGVKTDEDINMSDYEM